jgi:hypothetical protein
VTSLDSMLPLTVMLVNWCAGSVGEVGGIGVGAGASGTVGPPKRLEIAGTVTTISISKPISVRSRSGGTRS